ncbi:MAG: ABC transporter permease [Methanocaldococcus sp.]
MKIDDTIAFAFKNIKQKKTQSLLTIIGIVIGVLAMVSLISLGYGVQNYIHEEMMKMGSNKITILPMKQFGVPPSHLFTKKDVKEVEKVKGIDAIMYGWFGSCEIEYNGEKKLISYFYATPSKLREVYKDSGYKIEKGRWLEDNDKYACVIGYGTAYNLFDREIKVGDVVKIKDKKFKVVGILKEVGNQQDDNSVILNIDIGEKLFGNKDKYNIIVVTVKEGEDIKKVAEDIKKALKKSLGDEDFSVLTAEQLAESISSILGVITIFVVGVAAISLLVGAIGISNTMHMSILERRRDIGILKALGAETTDILAIFVIESGFLGLFGGIIGLVLGIAIAKGIEILAHKMGYLMVNAWISWELIVGVLIFSFLVGVISGYFPARSGAKLNPIETLRGE